MTDEFCRLSITIYIAQYLSDMDIPDLNWKVVDNYEIYSGVGSGVEWGFWDITHHIFDPEFSITGTSQGGGELLCTAELTLEGWSYCADSSTVINFESGEIAGVQKGIHLESVTLIGS